jgi:ectoine hydroxylase-related dioxygenase (phytanoyl-CoA dioxygenase family)
MNIASETLTGAAQQTAEQLVEEILERGYAFLDVLSPERFIDALLAEITQIKRVERPLRPSEPGVVRSSASHRIRNLASRSALLRDAMAFEPVVEILNRFLGPGPHLFASGVNENAPGDGPQAIHTDDLLIELPRPFARPLMLTVIWALTDFTLQNGATRLFPGTHRQALTSPPLGEPFIAAMPRGSILLYDGSLWHGAGANETADSHRIGMIFTYCARFIRAYEDPIKRLPTSDVQAMSPTVRQLVGCDY